MYPAGHYGVAMLFAVPIPFVLGRKPGTVVSAFVLVVGLLPDLDNHLPYVTHHGVTHTFLFAAVAGVGGGVLAAGAFVAYVRVAGEPRSVRLTANAVFVWAAIGLFVGTSSHVVADVLVLLPGTQPVSPFWPVFERKLRVEVFDLGAPIRNLVFLIGGLAAQTVTHHRVGARDA
ncbi:metal-dependent hydrolase [Halorussus marinus]|uniref:metal-dependent hydrolase n=1 Tax=Halorussus marinus TaxID=2505976 RepID=UPI001430C084|nr:metal-dependent hydrolase [Halorussus marinus]